MYLKVTVDRGQGLMIDIEKDYATFYLYLCLPKERNKINVSWAFITFCKVFAKNGEFFEILAFFVILRF